MFKRLFGNKGSKGASSSAEQATEDTVRDKTEDCINSMQTIRDTITGLENKIKILEEKCTNNMNEAKELKKKNPNDPRIKTLLIKVKKDRDSISNYNNVILKQEQNLTSLDDAAFIAEMFEIAEKTRDAMKKAVDGINDKIQDIMAEIEEITFDIKSTMEVITARDETDAADVDELMQELDNMLDEEQTTELPAAPTYSVVTEPVVAEKPENMDLEAMLAELFNIC